MANKQIEFEATVSAARINALLNELRAGAEGAAKSINDAFGGTVTKRIVFDEVRDDRGVKRLVAVQKERLSVADQIINRERKLAETQKGSATSLRQQVNNLRQQRDGVARYATSVGSVGGLIKKQTDEWTRLNTQLNTVSRQLDLANASGFWQQLKVTTRAQGFINLANGVNQVVQGLQAASIIIGQFQAAINAVVNSAAEVQSFALTFKAIGIGASGGTAALQEASRIALGLGSDLRIVQDGFRQLSPVVLNIGGSMGDVSSITETLSSRFAAFGISGDRARRVMNGVIQAFAKGKLQAEELTQQISEADPAFKTDFAKALLASKDELGKLGKEVDGSVANLEKLVKAGKITADVLLQVLPGLSKSSLLFGKLGPSAETALAALEKGNVTIDQVRANFNTLNELSLRKFAESATPLINAFLRIQAVTTDFLTRISQTQGAAAFAQLGATLFNVIASLADSFFVLVEGINTVVGAFKPLIDLLANVPGLAQGLGLLLIGNLVRPLGLFEKRIQKTKTSWSDFTNSILNTLSPSRTKIRDVSEAVGTLESRLAKTFQKTGLSNPLLPIVSSAEQATSAVDILASTATDAIDSKIVKTKSKLSELNEELEKARISQESIDVAKIQKDLRTKIGSLESQKATIVTDLELVRAASVKATRGAGLLPPDITSEQTVELLKKKLDDAIEELGNKLGRSIARPDIDIEGKIARMKDELLQSNISAQNMAIFAGREASKFQEYISEALALDPATFSSVDDFEKALNNKLADAAIRIASIGSLAQDIRAKKELFIPRVNEGLASGAGRASGGRDFSAEIDSLNQDIVKLDDQIYEARAKLADQIQDAKDSDPANAFSAKELKRQKNLEVQIGVTQRQLEKLYAQKAEAENLRIQTRRQQVGFDPDIIAANKQRYQDLLDLQKKADEDLFKSGALGNRSLQDIVDERQKIYEQLSKIESQRQVGLGTPLFDPLDPSTLQSIDNYKKRLDELKQAENDLSVQARAFADAQNNATKIFADGSKEGATFAEKQKAIDFATRLSTTAITENTNKIETLKSKLQSLKTERSRLLAEQAKDREIGPVPADDPFLLNLQKNKKEAEQLRAQIKALGTESLNSAKDLKVLRTLATQNIDAELLRVNPFAGLRKKASEAKAVFANLFDPTIKGIEEVQGKLDRFYKKITEAPPISGGARTPRKKDEFDPLGMTVKRYNELRNTKVESLAFWSEDAKKIRDLNEQIGEYTRRIRQVEKDRLAIARLGVRPPLRQEFRVEEIKNYEKEIASLTEERDKLIEKTYAQAKAETDYAAAIEEGTRKGATFEQRQLAISSAIDVANLSLQDSREKALKAADAIRSLRAEKKGLADAPENQTRISEIDKQIEQQKKALSGYIQTGKESKRVIDDLTAVEERNATTKSKLAGQSYRLGNAIKALQNPFQVIGKIGTASLDGIGRAFSNFKSIGIVRKGIDSIKEGLKGLAGFLDPITVAFLTIGVLTRLYSDGNKEAAQVAQTYADKLKVLQQAQEELLPGQRKAVEETSYLKRAWTGLAVATVGVADTIGSAFSGIFDGIGRSFEEVRLNLDKQGKGISKTFTAIAASALIAGGIIAGALIGSAILPVGGTAIGAVIGGVAAALTAMALSADNASNRLNILKKSLSELRQGAGQLARQGQDLSAGLLAEIPIPKTGPISDENIQRLKAARDAIKGALAEVKTSYAQLTGAQKTNMQDALALEAARPANIKKREELQQRARMLAASMPAQKAATPEYQANQQEIIRLQAQVRQLTLDIDRGETAVAEATASNRELANSQRIVKGNIDSLSQAYDNINDRLAEAVSRNRQYTNTISGLNEEVALLQQQNLNIDLGGKEGLNELDANLSRIKAIQDVLELLNKTKVELKIDSEKLQSEINQAQISIDIPPGPLREIKQLADEVRTNVSAAGDRFAENIREVNDLRKTTKISEDVYNQLTLKYAKEYTLAVRQAAGELADKGREFRDRLRDANDSLTNLKLSNPNFFTPSELKANAEQIVKDFYATVEKVRQQTGDKGFFPKIEGSTFQEKLQSMANFTSVRNEADDLNQSVKDIGISLDQVVMALTGLNAKQLADLKKSGKDVNTLLDKSGNGVNKLGKGLDGASNAAAGVSKALPRVGEVLGQISGGGQEFVLYFDNITKQVEQVTRAQFDARVAADKLAASGKGVGAGFEQGSGRAQSSVSSLVSRVGQVQGVITAGGKTMVLYYDTLTNQVETVDKATFDRLSKEKAITKENQTQIDKLDEAIGRFQTMQAYTGQRQVPGAPIGAGPSKESIMGSFVISAPNKDRENEFRAKLVALARQAGGDFVRTLQAYINNGENGVFSTGMLASLRIDKKAYEADMNALSMAQDAFNAKQREYNAAVASGSPRTAALASELRILNNSLKSAKADADAWNRTLADQSALAKELGIDLSTIPDINDVIYPDPPAQDPLTQWNNYVDSVINGTSKIQQSSSSDPYAPLAESAQNSLVRTQDAMQQWDQYVQDVRNGIQNIPEPPTPPSLENVKANLDALNGLSLQQPATEAGQISTGFENAALAAQEAVNSILSIDGTEVQVTVRGVPVPGRWAGGPVEAGQQYQVNELGKEGFLSSTGWLSPINGPANSLWRAPGSGTVIPADIWSKINAPNGRIRVNNMSNKMNGVRNQGEQLASIARQMNNTLIASRSNDELAIVQAQQAMEIGKLSSSVEKLAAKKWNVQVNVSPKGEASYLSRVNHRL